VSVDPTTLAIVQLAPGEQHPDWGDQEPWIIIEATKDDLFFGTGASWKDDGEWVGYCSLPGDDVSLAAALAAQEWARKYREPTIWVQLEP